MGKQVNEIASPPGNCLALNPYRQLTLYPSTTKYIEKFAKNISIEVFRIARWMEISTLHLLTVLYQDRFQSNVIAVSRS